MSISETVGVREREGERLRKRLCSVYMRVSV